jgi:signal peptidase
MKMVRAAGRILKWALNLVVVLLLLAFIAWFTAPRILGWQPQVVLSGSMEPALPLGSVAFVEPKSGEEVQTGDMLTFRNPDGTELVVTHRVTEVVRGEGGLAFKTKGDANEAEDSWLVPAANVVGTVKWHVHYLGYITDKVRTPAGFLLLIGLPAAFIVLGEVQNVVRQLWKPRPGKEGAS